MPASAFQRLAGEKTTLRDRLRRQEDETKTLTERLSAARTSNRPEGNEIADVQAQLLDQPEYDR